MKLNARRGFTLAEVLVTVTITAVLAAVVVPSVVNQVKKGDLPSFTSETQALGTAVGQFATDNRALPKYLGDLVQKPIDGSLDATWKGPYLSTGQDLSTATSVYTGAAYGVSYSNLVPATSVCSPSNFLPLTITKVNGVAIASVKTTDAVFKQLYDDLNNSPNTVAPVGGTTVGPLQYSATGGAVSTAYICMIAAAVN